MPKKIQIADIKDTTPNPSLIRQLEMMLKDAKSGELRTLVWMSGWDNDSVTHGWSLDHRNSARRILAELMLLTQDFTVNIGFMDDDSVLAKAFKIK